MKTAADDIRVLVQLLRALHNRSQAEMATLTGLHPSTLSRYEEGLRMPSQEHLGRLAAAAGVPMWAVEGVLLPAIALVRAPIEDGLISRRADDESVLAPWIDRPISVSSAIGTAEFFAEPYRDDEEQGSPGDETAAIDRGDPWGRAEHLWAETDVQSEVDCYQVFEKAVVTLCNQSERSAAKSVDRALDLARRAVGVADLLPGPADSRSRLGGYAWAFVGNALRVGGDLTGAEAAFVASKTLWHQGVPIESSGLVEWRLLDLEASLRRGRRQFLEALDLLKRALALAPVSATGRILLKKAFTLEQAGKPKAALRVLKRTIPLIDQANTEPRLRVVVRFNWIVLLCQLGRYAEGKQQMPELERLAGELENEIDLVRVEWLAGRIAALEGNRDEAQSIFRKVASHFTEQSCAYDAALVALELAVLYLEDQRTVEVCELAETMIWIFSSQAVHREAAAALALFRQAVEGSTITAELAHSVLTYLQRSRHDPMLAFEPPGRPFNRK